MPIKIKIFILAVLPLLLLTGLIAWVSFQIENELSIKQKQIFEDGLRVSKTKELEAHLKMALSAVEPILKDSRLTEELAQTEVKNIINGLRYGQDGYFFVYDQNGVNLVHPVEEELVGKNLYNKQDSEGRFVIRELLEIAQKGGGVTRYRWTRPSTQREEDKVGYVQLLPRWGWMIGSGLYDLNTELERNFNFLQTNINNSFQNILLILAFTITIIIALVIWTNLHESRLASQHLQALAHSFVQLQVAERRRFSQELHDGINQLMTVAKYRIELANSQIDKGVDDYRENLAKALTILDEAIKEVRGISHALRPGLLDELGLGPALISQLNQFQDRTKISVESIVELYSQEIPEDAAITLYRVAQESLTNIERHAIASQIKFRIQQTVHDIYLEISDNGHGFEPKNISPDKGIGLKNMRERIELLGGQFNLVSATGQGTKIQAMLPLSVFSRN